MATPVMAKSAGQPGEYGSSDSAKEPCRERLRRPNVFIAIPVNHPEVHVRCREVQQRIIDAVPVSKPYMESTRKLHLTLSLSAVEDDGLTEMSKRFSAKIKEIISSKLSSFHGTQLSIKGIGQFDGHRVIYCKVSETGFVLDDLFKELDEFLKSAGYPILHRPKLSAHLTLFKMIGKNRFARRDWQKISELFDEISSEDVDFGVQPVREIQLLHMMLPKDQNGYYAKLASSTDSESVLSTQSYDDLHKDCCAIPLRA